MTIRFEIPGPPKGKGRPRFAVADGKRVAFTPPDTVQYENLVKLAFRDVAPHHKPFDGPVNLELFAYFPIPKSRPKRWKEQACQERTPVTTRPDLDNILKVVCDALNGIAWADDRQIWSAAVTKLYGKRPRVVVAIAVYAGDTMEIQEVEDVKGN